VATDLPVATAARTAVTRGLAAAGRIVAAGLSAAMGAIHFHLWSTGYRHIHVMGILFLLNAIGGVLLAVALLVVPARMVGLVAAATAVFTAGTLAGLFLSLHVSLFGFREFPGAPFESTSIVIESIGTAVAVAVAAAHLRPTLAWYRQVEGRRRRA
jgi:hypothetical protein